MARTRKKTDLELVRKLAGLAKYWPKYWPRTGDWERLVDCGVTGHLEFVTEKHQLAT